MDTLASEEKVSIWVSRGFTLEYDPETKDIIVSSNDYHSGPTVIPLRVLRKAYKMSRRKGTPIKQITEEEVLRNGSGLSEDLLSN